MDNLEKIKRHLARPVPIKLKNPDGEEDIFEFRPLDIEQQAILMEISKRMQSREKIVVNDVEIPSVNKEDMKEMLDLICDIVRNSISGLDEKTLSDFVNTNFDQLYDKIGDLTPQVNNKSALDKIKKIQEENRAKRARGNNTTPE